MTKKSAASMKPAKKSITDERTPEEYFEEAKQGLIAIAKSYYKNVMRADNVLKDVLDAKDILSNEGTYSFLIGGEITNTKRKNYQKVIDILEALTYETLMKDDAEDPFEHMIPYVFDTMRIDSDASDSVRTSYVQDLIKMNAAFQVVRPFGEKLEQLKFTLKEMIDEEK